MNKILKVIFWIILLFQSFSVAFAATWKFQYSLNNSISQGTTWLQQHLNPRQTPNAEWWWRTVVDFVFNVIDDIVIPIAVSVWVVIWLIWAYKLLFSSEEKQVSTWLKMVIFWIIWVIIMVSAKYIWKVLFQDIFSSWEINQNINWVELSQKIYNQIAYPFIKIAIYLALTVIFIILVWKSISLITKSDWTSQKKALWMIGRCAVSMLLIIWAKSIVEAIYWKQDAVFNTNAQDLWQIWSWMLADKNIPIIYNVISRALWIVSLVILILLIIQWFKILINPSKAENFQKLWKHLLFTVIWLFVIWIVYLLTNAFILN